MLKKLFLIIAFALCLTGQAYAATYYVAQSAAGSADGSSAANASAIATFNAGTAPYDVLDDDTVYFIGTITTRIAPVDGGAAGHLVTLRGDYGANPAIVWQFFGNNKDYLKLIGMEILGNAIIDGDNCILERVNDTYQNGSQFALKGVSTAATAFDPQITATGATVLWMLADGTTSTSNPASKDYGATGHHPFAVVVNDKSKITGIDWNSDTTVGPLPDISGLTNLADWYSYANQHTGPLPDISGLTNLTHWASSTNQHTGPLPDISGLTNLIVWYSSTNQHTGPLPDISGLTKLLIWYSSTNRHTGSNIDTVSATIEIFRTENNLLTQSDVDGILCAFDVAGRAAGTRVLNVGGTGNAAPSATGVACYNNLIAKGWTVTKN